MKKPVLVNLFTLVGLLALNALAGPAGAQEVVDLALGEDHVKIYDSSKYTVPWWMSFAPRMVASGDLNGDGVGDLAFGAAGKWSQWDPQMPGEAYVVFGPFNEANPDIDLALTGGADITILAGGEIPGGVFGHTVAVADVTGDSQDDLIVGAPADAGLFDDRLNAGAVRVFFGPLPSGTVIDLATDTADLTIYGADGQPDPASYWGDALGLAIDAHDVSGDGLADLILGAHGGDGPGNERADRTGEVHVLFGTSFAPGTVIDLAVTPADATIYGAYPGDMGSSVFGGDVSGDGFADLVVSAPNASSHGSGYGETYVLFGPLSAGERDLANLGPDVLFYGLTPWERFGRQVTVGDVTGDGVGEVLVSDSWALNPRTLVNGGVVYVFEGPLSSGMEVPASEAYTTIYPRQSYTTPVPTVADLNADGYGDLIASVWSADGLGTPPLEGAGQVHVMWGPIPTGTLDLEIIPSDLTVYGPGASAYLGFSVSAGDVTGDGIEDLLMIAPNARKGTAYVLAGGPVCTDGDGDGYGSPGDASCPNGAAEDCDDGDDQVYPGAPEILCDGLDNDCDALTPDDVNLDSDPVSFCAGDCDDADANNYPGNAEVCDGQDNNCDAAVDEGTPDGDGDGVCDAIDNCPSDTNAGQEDCDGDGTGDVCDTEDTDADGLTDAQEINFAGLCPGGCPDPVDSDSDDDGLLDGFESDVDPDRNCDFCAADTDGDGVPDATDPFCNDPTLTGDCAQDLADFEAYILSLPTSVLQAPGANTEHQRLQTRSHLASIIGKAAKQLDKCNAADSVNELEKAWARVDGAEPPLDDMVAGAAEKAFVRDTIEDFLYLFEVGVCGC